MYQIHTVATLYQLQSSVVWATRHDELKYFGQYFMKFLFELCNTRLERRFIYHYNLSEFLDFFIDPLFARSIFIKLTIFDFHLWCNTNCISKYGYDEIAQKALRVFDLIAFSLKCPKIEEFQFRSFFLFQKLAMCFSTKCLTFKDFELCLRKCRNHGIS